MTRKEKYTINYRYYIVLFRNRKKYKLIHKSARRSTILKVWNELKTQKKPPYVKMNSGRKRTIVNFELALIFPKNRWSEKIYVKDDLGRNTEITLNNDKQRIKYIIPYWEEEKIYDHESKKRISYWVLLDYVLSVKDISQIFTLNNKLFVQTDNDIRMYGNKSLEDTSRLFEILKNDVLRRNKTNFLFVKDMTTPQRVLLYDLLENKGYDRSYLSKHYSY